MNFTTTTTDPENFICDACGENTDVPDRVNVDGCELCPECYHDDAANWGAMDMFDAEDWGRN